MADRNRRARSQSRVIGAKSAGIRRIKIERSAGGKGDINRGETFDAVRGVIVTIVFMKLAKIGAIFHRFIIGKRNGVARGCRSRNFVLARRIRTSNFPVAIVKGESVTDGSVLAIKTQNVFSADHGNRAKANR